MATVNTRGAYELLRRALMQHSLQQEGANFDSPPNGMSGEDADGYGSPQGGLLGRLRALQAEQSGRDTLPQPQDPNFRQLSRAPIVNRPPDANAPYRSNNQSSPSYPSVGSGSSLDALGVLPQSAGVPGAYGKLATRWLPPSPTAPNVPLGRSGRGMPIPPPPMAPGSLPPVSMPAIPDWWKSAGAILQILPRISYGMGGGGNDEDDCKDEIRRAREICTEAFANGWKGDYGLGPYKAASGEPWSIQDCMRGRISERCGGNPVDRQNDKGRSTRR